MRTSVALLCTFALCAAPEVARAGCGPEPLPVFGRVPLKEIARRVANDVSAYARTCREELGIPPGTRIPTMNCLDGQELPITLRWTGEDGVVRTRPLRTGNDAEDARYYEMLRRGEIGCDRPQWLLRGAARNSGCFNFALVQRVEIAPNIHAVLLCRQKRFTNHLSREQRIAAYRAAPTAENFRNLFEFNDMGFILTHTQTGRTCFFDRLGSFFGAGIPSPANEDTVDGRAVLRAMGLPQPPATIPDSYLNRTAHASWKAPSGIAGDGCVSCHSAGPWIISPWVRQNRVVPRNRQGIPYVPVQYGDFFDGFRSVSIDTGPVRNPRTGDLEPQECTACHRIGGVRSGPSLRLAPAFELSVRGEDPFMPHRHRAGSRAEWERDYDHHVRALRCCAENPHRIGCYVTDLTADPPRPAVAGSEQPPCASPRPSN